MATNKSLTIQSNIKQHTNANITNYSLFLGGINSSNEVLRQYDPLITGYGRLFMVRKPLFLMQTIPDQFNKFKHILEYANTNISGVADIELSTNSMTGGYAGGSIDLPNVATNSQQGLDVTVYETSGSLVREVIQFWINGIRDILTGLLHYNGVADALGTNATGLVAPNQANQTAEMVYVATDVTGRNVEFAQFLTNVYPKNIKQDQFNYSASEHQLVEYAIQFECNAYQSLQVNALAQELLNRYRVLGNALNFHSGIDVNDDDKLGVGVHYDVATGQLVSGALGSNDFSDTTPTDIYGGTAK